MQPRFRLVCFSSIGLLIALAKPGGAQEATPAGVSRAGASAPAGRSRGEVGVVALTAAGLGLDGDPDGEVRPVGPC